MHPQITGPASWPAAGPPPRFAVDAAGLAYWMAELATDPTLMACLDGRTPDNYFFGADAEGIFGAGPTWTVPEDVWARLGHATVLYYRLVAFDQSVGATDVSVDDQHLEDLPRLAVAGVARRCRRPA